MQAKVSELMSLKEEFLELKSRLELGLGKIDQTACSAGSKVEDMEIMIEGLREQLWELDESSRNKLVFYGVKEDGQSPDVSIKDVIRR